jgi:hypothetical protein
MSGPFEGTLSPTPDDAVFLPDGQDLDSGLLTAIEERMPAGALGR